MGKLYNIYLQHPQVCTDTRQLTPGCLFFALRGDNFNGNGYALQALEQGAAYAVVDDANLPQANERLIHVPNVLQALQQLAAEHRQALDIPIIALTGTNGKTTTKELVNAVLGTTFKTFATTGNLNNHIGVPLSLLSITAQHQMAVIEMGANHTGEIAALCEIARPTHGLITNVGLAHLEGFGGFEGVKQAKGELYQYLKQNDGQAFINADNENLVAMADAAGIENAVYYGNGEETDMFIDLLVSGTAAQASPYLVVDWFTYTDFEPKHYRATTKLTGAYNLENVLAAITIGRQFCVSPQSINKGLAGYKPQNNRSQVIETGVNSVIADFYNANPSSMLAALENFAQITGQQKLAILGDMFELGSEAEAQHLKIAARALEVSPALFIGHVFYGLRRDIPGEEALFFQDNTAALQWLKANAPRNQAILLKGSRGSKLEELLEAL